MKTRLKNPDISKTLHWAKMKVNGCELSDKFKFESFQLRIQLVITSNIITTIINCSPKVLKDGKR